MNSKTNFIPWLILALPLPGWTGEVTGIVSAEDGHAVVSALVRVTSAVPNSGTAPVRVADLFMDSGGMMSWLVFCSGPALKRPGRQIPLPSAFWKEFFSSDFLDETVCFDDSLGLPKSIDVLTKQGQLVFQYQVHQSTNVLGWNFPLEFYLAQYNRTRTNSFAVYLTGKGKVTAIKPAGKPQIPNEVLSAVEK